MSETCPFCGAIYEVICIGGSDICGACLEPINCPHCHKVVREERTTGTFSERLIKAPPQASPLSEYLGITDDEWEEMDAELFANDGSSGDMTYNYYFTVPEGTSDDILSKTGWEIGQTIDDIPVHLVDY